MTAPAAGTGQAEQAPERHAPRAPRLTRFARALAVAPITVYQRVVSPAIPRRCKYEPTCSRYAVEAIREYGILRGAVLAAWRLLRCNPWSYGGYDPVEAQRVFATGHRTGV
ncbi:MAG TPA: membrane protein insertion efficiency factor YidD [Solirubrobacteraceae bacterium]|nr:membrane protein insertion efficiency factor YidD [Solirubrobacteraceae bacterium]